MFAQKGRGVHRVLNQTGLFRHSMTPMPTDAPHLLPPIDGLQRGHRQNDLTQRRRERRDKTHLLT